jgi:hypothetical protein
VDFKFRNAAGDTYNKLRAESTNGRLNSRGWLQFADAMDQKDFAPPTLYLNESAQKILENSRYANTWRVLMMKGPRAVVRKFKRRVYEYASDVR